MSSSPAGIDGTDKLFSDGFFCASSLGGFGSVLLGCLGFFILHFSLSLLSSFFLSLPTYQGDEIQLYSYL